VNAGGRPRDLGKTGRSRRQCACWKLRTGLRALTSQKPEIRWTLFCAWPYLRAGYSGFAWLS